MKLTDPQIRGLKQAGRVALAAAVVNLGVALSAGGKLNAGAVVLGALVAAYEGASKYVATNPDIDLKGLFPF